MTMKTGTIRMGRAATFASALAVVMTINARGARAQEQPATAPPPSAVATQPATQPPAYAPPGAAPAAPSLKGASVWGILPWSGIGVGARYMLPLPIPPLLVNTNLRDTFNLEFGADYLHWSYDYLTAGSYSWSEIVPVVGMMWQVWLSPQFALYPKVELGYAFGWLSDWNYPGSSPTYGGFFYDGDVGALYKLNSGLTLRAEVGVDGLKLGAGFLF
jgi:hypothetical protein